MTVRPAVSDDPTRPDAAPMALALDEAKAAAARGEVPVGAVLVHEDRIIARAGKPVAVLSRFVAKRAAIAPPGMMAGEGWMAEDFDAPIDELFDALREDHAPAAPSAPAWGGRTRRSPRR